MGGRWNLWKYFLRGREGAVWDSLSLSTAPKSALKCKDFFFCKKYFCFDKINGRFSSLILNKFSTKARFSFYISDIKIFPQNLTNFFWAWLPEFSRFFFRYIFGHLTVKILSCFWQSNSSYLGKKKQENFKPFFPCVPEKKAWRFDT